MRIYIAGSYKDKPRLYEEAKKFGKGDHVVSSWLREPHDPNIQLKELTEDEIFEIAVRDVAEIKNCNVLILDTLTENSRGGREVEYGFAMGQGRLVVVIGPLRNVFHQLADQHFQSWEEFWTIKNKSISLNVTGNPKDKN